MNPQQKRVLNWSAMKLPAGLGGGGPAGGGGFGGGGLGCDGGVCIQIYKSFHFISCHLHFILSPMLSIPSHSVAQQTSTPGKCAVFECVHVHYYHPCIVALRALLDYGA
jgi:hypothetical protein